MMRLLASTASLLALPVSADLPVHCLRHQVTGEWKFVATKPSPSRTACGHNRPDTEEGQPARSIVDSDENKEELSMLLQEPNVVKHNGQSGQWTMIYDEGFEVSVGNRVYFAFSNYTLDKDPAALSRNTSHCGDTIVGWYSNSDRTEFGCYYGVRSEVNNTMPSTPLPRAMQAKSAKHDEPLDHEAQKAKVEKLNKKLAMLQLGWKARTMPKWNGRTMREVNGYAGIRRTVPVRDLHTDMLAQRSAASGSVAPVRKHSFLQKDEVTKKPRNGKIPETFDWSAADGIDFLEPVMDQADCGSCYDASTMRMLTVRHKINLNNTEAIPWSINFPLHCSEYNQGCKGGFGFLTTKWSQDVGLIPATCMRYDTKGTCKLECDLDKELKGQKRYRAANHRYVNSWYGNFNVNNTNATVEAVKEEIYRNGPVVMSFEPAEDFMFYSEGVYKTASPSGSLKPLRKHVDFDQEWERVDHAVLAVGWGQENGTAYWRIQNSWGPDWGEDGFFRMAMGVDESGVESSPEAADVVEDEQNGRQVAALFAENAAMQQKKKAF
eukprot:TRINITY_DN10075_c0_g2_i3.p1 TRINITY_DN10075_c0_g2~~TRINITY_DN10075_c0_g2_i3.p1  ORF type:complete len:549 (+),score=151.65 TRINITY_DN10075_c0_g2_i3:106-1752(+)